VSACYYPFSPIYITALIDRGMKEVRVHQAPSVGSDCFSLTDGWNFLWVYFNGEGRVTRFARWASNGDPDDILTEIADTFDVKIVSECDSQYWGFESEEEFKATQKTLEKKRQAELYNNIVKFIRGESNTLKPGSVEMAHAEIAKRLVTKSSNLLAPDKRMDLIKAVETIYDWEDELRAAQAGELPF
jgi:hypothetical protein